MTAILNNKDYLKDEICKAIDNAGAAAPYGNITNGDILDALLELRDTLLTNIAKRQQIMEEMWLARDKSGCLYLYKGKPIKYSTYWRRPLPKDMIRLDNSLFPEVQWSDEEPTKVKLEIVKQYDKNNS